MRFVTRRSTVLCTLCFAIFSVMTITAVFWQGRFLVDRYTSRNVEHKFTRRPVILYNTADEGSQNVTRKRAMVAIKKNASNSPHEDLQTRNTEPNDVILQEQARRHQTLNEGCNHLNISRSTTVDYNHMLVNDPHKILFNFIPKVSCKSWKSIFGKLRKYNSAGKLTLGQYPPAERNYRLSTYRKVLFVRDPMSRILSAYMSKFRGGMLYDHASLQRFWEKRFGRDIVRRYRGINWAPKQEGKWLNITLVEFLLYVTDLGSDIKMTVFNDHWLPQHIVSHPCQIKYDFIGHFENLSVEGPYVLRWLEIDHLVEFPEYHNSNAMQSLIEYYKHVPLDLIRELTEYYQVDYKLFGYSVEENISRMKQTLFEDHDS